MPLALTIQKVDGKPGEVYYPLHLKEIPKPTPGPGEVLIRLSACALNHRDLFIRQHLYPLISFENPLLADGTGTVIALGPSCAPSTRALLDRPVILTPNRGWASDPDGPEDYFKHAVIGGTTMYDAGTAQEYIVVPEGEIEPRPEHLSAAEAAALPLVGLTGWRAFVTKTGGNAKAGRNILVTGIGGGVALVVLQFAVAMGCNVWVTSGDKAKIEKAKELGAKGGVVYKDADWDKQLAGMLPEDRPYLDAVVDGAGGDIMKRTVRILKAGGVISCYGMTLGPKMDWSMQAVMKNIELRGSTMGSRVEFKDMLEFVNEKKVKPVVSRVVKGLGNMKEIETLYDDMKHGKQFGKLVIEIDSGARGSSPGKL